MKIRITAISRIRSGPERQILDDYFERCTALGRSVGLGPLCETQIDNRSLKTRADESRALAASLDTRARIVLLDERGKSMKSTALAKQIASWRDDGCRELVFGIGGADGHDHALLPKPDLMLALGPAVWPHKLVRIMIAEQIFRATSIIAGTPYHRE